MMQDKNRILLILALIFISLGGFLLHLRIHPVFNEGVFEWGRLIPVIFGILSILVIPCLFLKRETADLAYLLSGISVIFGIITMSHLSIFFWEGDLTLSKVLFKTTLADSLMLMGKFFIAKAIFENYYPERAELNRKFPQTFRFLFDGWWLVHFLGITAVYALGAVLFK